MAIQFKLVKETSLDQNQVFTIASQAFSIGDAVMLSTTAGTVVPATSSTTPSKLIGVAMEAKVSGDTTLLVTLINPHQTWAADGANPADATKNLQRMVLTDKGTVNNTGTDSTAAGAVFRQEGVLAGSRITGKFLAAVSA